ncbi:putative AMI1 protein [Fusarium proliferatum ET1]|uniref:Probable AMI1 protein n=1 Tax=Fusarium proliferatum (strain ET1) TaxID=1227346 RepID=A0A1L7VNB8_FUSPR|nr:putative AMI1 protein [Fusarium proliferatum ET1]CZR41852.1 probable AMI1 protein [Fusarium proliferatum ET1]
MASSLASDKPSLPAPGAAQYDPFITTTPPAPAPVPAQHRYSNYDHDFFVTGPASPESAKRALAAHLQETERRLEEAGKLGNALVLQRKQLTEQLKEIEKVNNEEELSQELRERMVGIEKEFNTLTRESARNLLPKQRVPSNEVNPNSPFAPENKGGRRSVSPSKFESQATGSPTKLTVPNRKIRNQPSNRVHDIEFAAEISTSLIAQVRNLQGVLAERDEENKDLKAEKARLELEAEGFQQRFKSLDESENRYKEENWNLETKLQELTAQHKEALDREKKLTQSLNVIKTEKVTIQRELDEVKVHHARLIDQHAAAVKQHDIELGTVKRNIAMAEGERAAMQRRIDDLTGQNQELARAFASQRRTVTELEPSIRASDDDLESSADHLTPEHSPPVSPIKGTPRHAMLETETMKSSLSHAQRTIQSQRGLLHREKTEKLELRRIIQDLRDDLEKARSDAGEHKPHRKSRVKESKEFKKPPRLLGSFRSSRQEVITDDGEWEDQHDVSPRASVSPMISRSSLSNSTQTILPSIETSHPTDTEQFETANEGGESAFETANERGTETEDFQTGAEEMSGSDDTETEGTTRGFGSMKNAPRLPAGFTRHASSNSLHSTASTSGDEDDYSYTKTPTGTIGSQRSSRFRMSRSIFNRSRQVSEEPNFQSSPVSFASSREGTPQAGGQSLFAELQDFGGSDDDSAGPGTPSRMRARSMTPGSIRRGSSPRPAVPPMPKVIMVDSGMMTEPVKIVPRLSGLGTSQMSTTGAMTDDGDEHFAESPVSVVAAIRRASMHSSIGPSGDRDRRIPSWAYDSLADSRPVSMTYSDAGAQHDPDMEKNLALFPAPPSMLRILPPNLTMSSIESEEVEPVLEPEVVPIPPALTFTALSNQSVEPVSEPGSPVPDLTMTSIISQDLEPLAEPVVLPPALSLSGIMAHSLEPKAEPEVPPPDLSMTTFATEQVEPIVEPEIPAPALSLSSISTEIVDPIAEPPVEPVMFMPPPPALSMSSIIGEHVEPVAPKNPELSISNIRGENIEPISEPVVPAPELLMSTIRSEHVAPVAQPETEVVIPAVVAPSLPPAPALSFSAIQGENVEPVASKAPELAMSNIVGEVVEPIAEPVQVPVIPELTISTIHGEQVEPVIESAPELTISAIQGEYIEPTDLPPPDLALSSITIQSVEPISEPEKVAPKPSLNLSSIYAEGCEPREELPPTPTTLVFSGLSTQNVEPVSEPAPSLALSGITSENVEPVLEPLPLPPTLVMSDIATEGVEPVSPVHKTPTLPAFGFSNIESIETFPVSPRTPKRDGFILPRDMKSPFMEQDVPRTPENQRGIDQGSSPLMVEDENGQSPSDTPEPATPDSERPFDKPVVIMNDQGAQTSLTADVIDAMFKARAQSAFSHQKSLSMASIGTPGTTGTSGTVRIRRSQEMFETPSQHERDTDDVFNTSPIRRPGSSRSGRASVQDAPPLPANHRQVIEAARSNSSHGPQNNMGPPLWPASALKQRPTTPGNRAASPASTARATPTQRTVRNPVSYGELGRQSPSKHTAASRKSSVSSFASELDTRFNMRPGEMGMDPSGFGPNTDPRMIQAITQTMIGEYLWKYTRKTGRGEMSENRHRRYFWVHPYTRTLYWSDRDPSTAGRTELKAKSVPIEAVRVVTDDNPSPPGLHRKSLVIISPGRTIKFTCATGQRHETWFNSLSYLLLRTNNEQANVEDMAENFTREDVDEFNPQFGQRAANGTRPGAPPSLSSYNSRTTRNESPAVGMSMNIPTLTPKAQPQRPTGTLSKLSGYWKGSQLSGTLTSRRGRGSAHNVNIYEASEAHDSAEDVREIIERQDREADRLENVRACCDGKHDVGTLHHFSKRGRHGNSTHTHSHPGLTHSHTTMSSLRSRV